MFDLDLITKTLLRNFTGLFTWREGAPANQATRLEELTNSPPLHATHLTGTVNWLSELPFERPLSTINKMADQRNVFSLFSASCTDTSLFPA